MFLHTPVFLILLHNIKFVFFEAGKNIKGKLNISLIQDTSIVPIDKVVAIMKDLRESTSNTH